MNKKRARSYYQEVELPLSPVTNMLATLDLIIILSVVALHSLDATCSRAVLSHFILGNVNSYKQQDWEQTFDLASKASIDSFVFNIGRDSWTETQLDLAFSVAPNYFTKICFSFDLAVASWDTQNVIETLKKYATQPGHYKYDGKYLVSTFDGGARANVDWVKVKDGVPNIFVVPHLPPNVIPPGIDGVLNWNAWPTRDNKPIDGNSSTVDDYIMEEELTEGQAYATLVSPWSFTDFSGNGVTPPKNWIFKSDELLVTRWNQMLKFASDKPGAHIDLVELYSWNDYGESNYQNDISKSLDDEFSGGSEAWCKGFKHDGWRLLNIPFTKAFKAEELSVTTKHIDTEMVVFHHRPFPAKTLCTGQKDRILGYDIVPDQVTIISMLKSPAQLVIKSGNKITNAQAQAGLDTNRVHMELGSQTVTVMRNGTKCGEVTSTVVVKDSCDTPNFNANVETVFLKC